ncbi:MAG: ATP-binding protein [Cyclobacteriaceae bacterium]|nr:ATP-binding protein [Cyclobacteriaceae bacterium]
MVRKTHLFLMIFLILKTVWLGAQDRSFYQFSIEDGLSQNTILAVHIDHRGFLWVGTRDGLNRYDGNEFQVFQKTIGDSSSLLSSNISTIFEDNQHNLWIGTEGGGISLFDEYNETFQTYLPLGRSHIFSIHQSPDGLLWLGTEDGLVRMDPNTMEFWLDDQVPSGIVGNIINESDNELWVSVSGQGLYLYDTQTGIKKWYASDISADVKIGTEQITTLFKDSYGYLWAGTHGDGVYVIDKNEKPKHFSTITTPKLANDIIYDIQEYRGKIWLGTDGGGINILDHNPTSVEFVSYSSKNPDGLPSNVVNVCYLDPRGKLWVGTFDGGLCLYNEKGKRFFHYEHNPYQQSSLPHNSILSFLNVNHDNIWIGTDGGGLTRFNPSDQSFSEISSIGDKVVKSLSTDAKGNIWVATLPGSLYQLTDDGKIIKKLTHEKGNPATPSHKNLWVLYPDSDGMIWIGYFDGGLDRFNPVSGIFENFLNDPTDNSSLSHNRISAITEDANRNIWIGTKGGGLNRYNRSTNTFEIIAFDPNDTTSLPSNEIHDLFVSKSGALWIGTHGGGLCRIDQGKLNRPLNSLLLPNVIYSIEEDDAGFLWLGTNDGLVMYMPGSGEYHKFSKDDGLQSREFKEGASLFSNQTMYFGGIKGFNQFFPSKIWLNTDQSNIVLTQFQVNGIKEYPAKENPRLTKPIYDTRQLTLLASDKNFSLHFSYLNYLLPLKNQFSYILEGVDQQWSPYNSNHSANYTDLKPGNYLFKVKAANNDGQRSNEILTIKITKEAYWWEQRWIRASIVLLFLIIFSSALYSRTRFLKAQRNKLTDLIHKRTLKIENQKEEILQENRKLSESFDNLLSQQEQLIEAEKMASIGVLVAGLAHELNNPLNFIGGVIRPMELNLRDIKSLIPEPIPELQEIFDEMEILMKDVTNGTRRATEIIEKLMAVSPEMNNTKRMEFDLSEILRTATENINRSYKNVQINYTIPSPVFITSNPIEITQVFYNIIKNAVEAVKQSNGQVWISSDNWENQVTIYIRDNGIGILKEKLNVIYDPFYSTKMEGNAKGLGLFIAYTLLKKNRGNINVVSKIGEGTIFSVSLPKTSKN